MAIQFTYDVFLSHSSKDKPVVRALAERLRADGLRVWFDEWIRPEPVVGSSADEGLTSSRVLILAMSRHAFDSDWITLESDTFRFRDPVNNDERRFIPLRLDDANIHPSLKGFTYVDWRAQSDAEYGKLLAACQLSKNGRREPENAISQVSGKTIWLGASARLHGATLSGNGARIAAGFGNKNIGVWDVRTGTYLFHLKEHSETPCIGLCQDGHRVISGSEDSSVRVWDLESRQCIATLIGHIGAVLSVSLSVDGRIALSGSSDRTVRMWEVDTGRCITIFEGHTGAIPAVTLSADGLRAMSGSADSTVKVWDVGSGRCIACLEGHVGIVRGVAISGDGHRAVSCSDDATVRVWDIDAARCIAKLQGHTGPVEGVGLSADGTRAVSASRERDNILMWNIDKGQRVGELAWGPHIVAGVGLSADGETGFVANRDGLVWVFPWPSLTGIGKRAGPPDARYTNAKVLLVGESGVGKTGLAYRLTENSFKPTISTDAAWATQLKLRPETSRKDVEREIWLWDFAGQADYRLIHQLYMDETALAVLVFNPQSENPFEGLGQWDRDLQRAARRRFHKLLVAGRIDRGGLMLSRASVDQFRKERGFAHYVETSALTGEGCDALYTAIVDHIAWDDIPWTVSPRIFRLLRDEIVKLKDEGKVLLRSTELKQQLEMRLPGEHFTIDELRAVAGLLAGPGVVWRLEFGDFILLQPERINAYAAAVIRKVRAHIEEIGCVPEDEVLAGNLDFQDMQRLPVEEEQIVLRAMHQTFVDHGLCLREFTDQGTLLIFPSYFKRERPEVEGHPLVLMTYQFSGPLEEIYATLIVRLHYTSAFERDRLWRFAADFLTPEGRRLGLKMEKKAEGAAEMKVYFESGISMDAQVAFTRYLHEHLAVKAQDVVRLRHYVCLHCGEQVEGRRAIELRLAKGFKDIFCPTCGARVLLWDVIEQKFASDELRRQVRMMEERAKAAIDNESRELILVGHAFSTVGESGHIFRPTPNSDWGIDGEIEFKNSRGEASGRRVYLQLKSGDSYLSTRQRDGNEVFTIKNARHAQYWQQHEYPVMLVIRTSDSHIRWMNVTDCLRRQGALKQINFDGEPFTALTVVELKRRLFPELESPDGKT